MKSIMLHRLLRRSVKCGVRRKWTSSANRSDLPIASARRALSSRQDDHSANMQPDMAVAAASSKVWETLKLAKSLREVEATLNYIEDKSDELGTDFLDAKLLTTIMTKYRRFGEPEKALELFRTHEGKIGSDVIVYNAAIAACAPLGRWRKALNLLERMDRLQLEPSPITYSAVLDVCRKAIKLGAPAADPAHAALEIGEVMRRTPGCEPTPYVYGALLTVCEYAGFRDESKRIFDEIKERNFAPDPIYYSGPIGGCVSQGRWQRACELLDAMRQNDLEVNIVTINATMAACEKVGQYEKALALFDELIAPGLDPQFFESFSENSFILAVCASVQAGDLQRALGHIQNMTNSFGFDITPGIYRRFMTAPSRTTNNPKAWNTVFDLSDQLIKDGFVLNEVCFTGLIDAICSDKIGEGTSSTVVQDKRIKKQQQRDLLENGLSRLGVFALTDPEMLAKIMGSLRRAGHSDFALTLFEKARENEIQMTYSAYGAAMWAYSSSKNLEQALSLLNEMKAQKVRLTAISYNAALAACRADQVEEAMNLFKEFKEHDIEPNALTFSILILLQEQAQKAQEANALMVQARALGFYQNIWRGVNTISVTGLSPSEVRTALRLAIQVAKQHIQDAHRKDFRPKPILVVNTGRGRVKGTFMEMFSQHNDPTHFGQGEFFPDYTCEEDSRIKGLWRIYSRQSNDQSRIITHKEQ